jgi:hypothetical protein
MTKTKLKPFFVFLAKTLSPSSKRKINLPPTTVRDFHALFAWLISHQPAVLFSHNKPATSNQYSSLRTNQHQPSATSQPNRLTSHGV